MDRPPFSLSIRRTLPLLLCRIAVFLALLCLAAVFLYVLGAAQGFLDATQEFLLRFAAILGVLLGLAAVFGVVLDLILLVTQRRLARLAGMGAYAVLGALGIAAAGAAYFILSVAGGNLS